MIGWLLTHGPARRALGLILAAAAILLFLLNLRRAGERAGRAAERLDARERNDAIQPLVPYLDTLRWLLIAIALIGIAVTIHARLDDWKRGKR